VLNSFGQELRPWPLSETLEGVVHQLQGPETSDCPSLAHCLSSPALCCVALLQSQPQHQLQLPLLSTMKRVSRKNNLAAPAGITKPARKPRLPNGWVTARQRAGSYGVPSSLVTPSLSPVPVQRASVAVLCAPVQVLGCSERLGSGLQGAKWEVAQL
jgi:hypothetical protein